MIKVRIKKKENKNRKRQIIDFAFFVILFIITFFCCNRSTILAAVIAPTSSFYVNDEAGILTTQTKQYIINTNIELQKATGAQIVVVTVKSLNGMSIEDYANQLFNSWEIGDKDKNNGVLLLCSYGDRKFRVEVGYGLEGKLPDGKTGRIQDEYIIPDLKQNRFDSGIKNGYSAFLKEVADEYNITITGSENAVKKGISQETQIMATLAFFVLAVIVTLIQINFRGRGGPFIFYGGGRPGGFHGGGFSGGSGFHGGGGHSGGGGSSRSF